MGTSYLWHLWPGRHWPLLPDEEHQFITELELLGAPRRKTFDRGDLIAVMNALRCGLSAAELLTAAPGVDPGALHAAYQHLDTLRSRAVHAWQVIAANPDADTIAMHGHEAAKLFPVPVQRMMANATYLHDSQLASIAEEAGQRIAEITQRARSIEEQLRQHRPPSREAVLLGQVLYNPYDPQLWGDPYFLPERAGALMPVRVCDLLEEPR